MRYQSQRAKKIRDQIRLILLHDWDPIGVSDTPAAHDEYDSCVAGIYGLLASGASEYQIVERLYSIQTTSMGLPGDRETLKVAAEKLAKLNAS
ncbi:MAG TPA: hypothetical protein VIP46_08890 [Pyrinomonadaceae bacterium]